MDHVRPQDGVDPRLISRALRLEPLQDLRVDAERDRLLRRRLHHRGCVPEIVRQIRQLLRGRRLDLSFGHPPQSHQVSPAAHGLTSAHWWPSGRLRAHDDCSFWPK